jgi:small conductance mechanosensitive channel
MTVLRTLEDARVIIPNRRIVGEIIYNYTAERRVPLTISLAYGENLDDALQVINEVLAANPRVLKNPAPEVGITRLDDSGIVITLRPWCRAEEYWQVHYEVYHAILDRFAERRIALATPRQEVRLVGASS